jgi:putative N6-adenine-specific DNA methylase
VAFSAFAVTAPGLEVLAAAELSSLGLEASAPEPGGVAFEVTERSLAHVLINLRTVTRVLIRVAEFRATSFAQLEKKANAIGWASWLPDRGRARFRVTCRKSRLYHSDAVAERLAGALTGAVTGAVIVAAGDEETDEHDPSQLFVVRMAHDVCTISADAAGAPLYKRGYRTAVAKAPIRETLAAAIILGANWRGDTALHDPFCGAGTLAIEAAMIARRIAPGLAREFAAERWPAAREKSWREARDNAAAISIPRAGFPITGGDRDAGAIDAARANAARAGVEGDVRFDVLPVSAARASAPTGLLATNPPYGVRVGDHDLRNLYASFGRTVREEFGGWRCAILFGDNAAGRVMEQQFGVPLAPAWRSMNGGIPIRLMTGDVAPRR